jgi:hypothetical protein
MLPESSQTVVETFHGGDGVAQPERVGELHRSNRETVDSEGQVDAPVETESEDRHDSDSEHLECRRLADRFR